MNFIKEEDIYLNVELKNKKDIFNFVFQEFKNKDAVHEGYLESMISRDQISSVALGNYLFLPHGKFEDQDLIIKNSIIFISLKEEIIIDDQNIKFIVGLALNNDNQIDAISKIALAFMDENKLNQIMRKSNLNKEDIINFLNQS